MCWFCVFVCVSGLFGFLGDHTGWRLPGGSFGDSCSVLGFGFVRGCARGRACMSCFCVPVHVWCLAFSVDVVCVSGSSARCLPAVFACVFVWIVRLGAFCFCSLLRVYVCASSPRVVRVCFSVCASAWVTDTTVLLQCSSNCNPNRSSLVLAKSCVSALYREQVTLVVHSEQ